LDYADKDGLLQGGISSTFAITKMSRISYRNELLTNFRADRVTEGEG